MKKVCLAILCLLMLDMMSSLGEESSESRIRPGHNLLGDQEQTPVSTGTLIGPLAFRLVSGESVHLDDALADGPAVFVFMSTKCPLAKRYTLRLNRIHASCAGRGVRMFAVFPNSDETADGIDDYLKVVQYPFDAVRDVTGYVASRLGATMTPQAFVVDQQSILRYRGAIDDNRYETRVKQQHLADALDSVLAAEKVEIPSVKAIGCSIHQASMSEAGEVTYVSHVARILQDNCQSCHRTGQVAPFALTNYDEACQWKTEIQHYTHARLMPPWKAVRGFGEFKNDVSLTDDEITVIEKWVDQGTPLGDPADMPPEPRFNDGWAFGQPDLIVEMPEDYVVGPEGEDDYRHFIVPYESSEDRYIEAVDVRPGNRSVVHHVIGYVDTSGKARELDAADEGPGYTRFGDVGFRPASLIGGWAPGNLPVKTPSGAGRWLPKKCDIVLQVHYYRTGVEERDRTKLGVYFSRVSDPVRTRMSVAINQKFVVPPGEKHYEVKAQCEIKESSYLFAVTPHMHLIGETMEVIAETPDGEVIPVVKINDWDFNWQNTYHFGDFQYLPAGTKVKLTATFDNSAENPNNPNSPPKPVGWGEKTTDEMCIAFLGLLNESEYDPEVRGRRTPPEKNAAVAVSRPAE